MLLITPGDRFRLLFTGNYPFKNSAEKVRKRYLFKSYESFVINFLNFINIISLNDD